MSNLPLIYDLDQPGLASIMEIYGEPAYRIQQIWQGLYRQFWQSPAEFTSLPAKLRAGLAEQIRFEALQPAKTLASSDRQTVKTLFELQDKLAIEAVLMRYDKRNTLCISTQAGCAMGCVFCATGQMGFKRHLTSGEIIAQVLYYARLLQAENTSVTNVVLMGMGEPFHNYDNTMAAIERLNHPEGFNFGARRFTISTVGLVPFIRRFASEKRQVNLAVSLHAADDALRSSMMPVNKTYPVDEVLSACSEYTNQTGRRITFEWALIHAVNDTPEQARVLARKLKNHFSSTQHGTLCHVNAIPLNPTTGYAGQPTSRERAAQFKEILEQAGIPCTIRMRRGIDIQAGCGQLAISSSQSNDKKSA